MRRSTEHGSSSDEPSGVSKAWWRRGYGRLAAALGVIGLIFTLAQLPVQLAGFPGTAKQSINVIHRIFAPPSRSDEISPERIGHYEFANDSTLGAAIRALGRPSSKRAEGSSCLLEWQEAGIEAEFVSSVRKPCSGEYGFFCDATISGHQWKTTKGLRVGDSIERLQSLYPSAQKLSAGFKQVWKLEAGTTPCSIASSRPVAEPDGLDAMTMGDYVQEFDIYYLAIGE